MLLCYVKRMNWLFLITLCSNFLSLLCYQNTIPKNSWDKIQKIIQQTEKSSPLRKKVNDLLYRSFEHWAIHQAYEFKKFHKHKCRNIKLDDLILSSRIGLYRSIDHYKGTSSFPRYSQIYVQGSLMDCLTLFHPLTNVPKNHRRKSKKNLTPREKLIYKKQLETSWVSYEDFWRFDKMQKDVQQDQMMVDLQERENHVELWKKWLDPLDPMTQKVIHYKYNYDFQVIRSNREIGELMGYSEEYVRLKLEKSKIHMHTHFTL